MSNLGVDITVHVAEDVAVTSTYTTENYDIQYMEGFSFCVKWGSGSNIVGFVTLEASVNGKDFITVDASKTKISGISGSHIYDVSDFHFRFMRLKVTLTSGNSTVNVWLNTRSRRV